MTYKKKLIEVSLPLEAINTESAREKSIRHGHPSTLHLWWARRPLAACRAVLFASMVDDPSAHPDKFPTEEDQKKERQRLHDLIGQIVTEEVRGKSKQVVRGLVSWDDIKDTNIVEQAQKEIARSLAWNRGDEPPTKPEEVREYLKRYAPPVYDPFCGGGSIPLEAQRLGLEAHGSDLNPVAVLITKALIEIPPKFKDKPPVNPKAQKQLKTGKWYGAQGLAEDVRYYGQWMRDEAEKRIGHLYPKVELPEEYGGGEATVIAWLWARTVKCPNPACGCQMPLVRSFQLSSKKGKEAWVQPIIDPPIVPPSEGGKNPPPVVRFEVKANTEGRLKPKEVNELIPEGTVSRKGAVCIACETPVDFKHIRTEGKAKRMDAMLMAVVGEGDRKRVYVSPNEEQERIARSAEPEWKPDAELPDNTRDIRPQIYGLPTYGDLFTPRQLVALTTFSDLVGEARKNVKADAITAGMADDGVSLSDEGIGATAYGDAIAVYLGFGVSRLADRNSTICSWDVSRDSTRNTFARQAIPMTWDYAEANPLSDSTGNFNGAIDWISKVTEESQGYSVGKVRQLEAMSNEDSIPMIVSTDPPYYDNICYADLSDFFYVWLRKSLGSIYSQLCSTLLVPKSQELVATPYRFGGDKQKAQAFFEEGLGKAFQRMRKIAKSDYPLTVYYAFKQTEVDSNSSTKDAAFASTGWETMLEGLIKSGFVINGTLPMRTEMSNRTIASGSNALASSIVLVCRPRPEDTPAATRRQFLTELKRELPEALEKLQQANIAPVDLAQASIGPGMAVYSRYSRVLEADGTSMRVRTALQLINQILDEFLNEQEGEFDADTRWALTWFEQNRFEEGSYGEAETLSKAKNTSVKGLEEAGILIAKAGKVRLLTREEYPDNWQPDNDSRTPHWELTQHLIKALLNKGETGAAQLLSKVGDEAETARDLAYRLYSICDRKGWAQEATAYNSLVISWSEISRLAVMEQQEPSVVQGELF